MTNIAKVDYRKYLDKKRDCIICGSKDFNLWVKSDIFDVVECKSCSLVFVNPCLNSEGLELVYKNHHKNRIANTEECFKRDKMYEIDRDFLLEVIDKGRILDVGCGGGFFLNKFDKRKWERNGVEIDHDTTDYARENFGLTDIRLWDSGIIPFNNEEFDVVVFRGSYEHMVNPHLVAREVKRVLKENGYLYLCATPNVDSFCARIYREKWNQFDAKEHIFMFSFKTLKKMIELLGFSTVKTATFYEETPYCNLDKDIEQVMRDYQLYIQGKHKKMSISPAFWGNILNIIFRKK